MKKKPYKRKPGESEIRILPDGRIVMIAPDQELLDIGTVLEAERNIAEINTENIEHERTEDATEESSTEEQPEQKPDI